MMSDGNRCGIAMELFIYNERQGRDQQK